MSEQHKQLAEEVALTALKMESALTTAYELSLRATDQLHAGKGHLAADTLMDAALMADNEAIAAEFRQHARDAERLGDD